VSTITITMLLLNKPNSFDKAASHLISQREIRARRAHKRERESRVEWREKEREKRRGGVLIMMMLPN